MWLPSVRHILLLHQKLVEASGGSVGLRDIGLVESALARAQASFGMVEAHPGVIRKAAAVGCGLVQNHGFVDGNKRIGMAVMLLILKRNAVSIVCSQQDVISLGLNVAQKKMDVDEVSAWIEQRLKR